MIVIHAVNNLQRLADAAHIQTFRREYGRAGLVLHAGSHIEWPAPDVLAA